MRPMTHVGRRRLIIATLAAAGLLLLFGWQLSRERRIRACLEEGGAWDGAVCGPPKVRPILRRDLQRS
jgi:hypothetical protein